jgi:hypothetical protein
VGPKNDSTTGGYVILIVLGRNRFPLGTGVWRKFSHRDGTRSL